MPRQHLYIIDLDGTLFKSDELWKDFEDICCTQHTISKTLFDTTYELARTSEGAFDIDTHLHNLDITQGLAQDYLHTCLQKKNYMFPDVIPFFEKRTKDDVCMILTKGTEWFQTTKARALPLSEFIQTVIVTPLRKQTYLKEHLRYTEDALVFHSAPYKSITFIDNMADAFIKKDDADPRLIQIRIRRAILDDHYAEVSTREDISEISSLTDI